MNGEYYQSQVTGLYLNTCIFDEITDRRIIFVARVFLLFPEVN